MFNYNKTLPVAARTKDHSLHVLVVTEIELKKSRTLVSEVSRQKTMVLLSEKVIDKSWSLVKIYRSFCESRYWVKDIFLYCITQSTLYYLVHLSFAPLALSNFQQSGLSSLLPPKDWQRLLLPFWVMHLPKRYR